MLLLGDGLAQHRFLSRCNHISGYKCLQKTKLCQGPAPTNQGILTNRSPVVSTHEECQLVYIFFRSSHISQVMTIFQGNMKITIFPLFTAFLASDCSLSVSSLWPVVHPLDTQINLKLKWPQGKLSRHKWMSKHFVQVLSHGSYCNLNKIFFPSFIYLLKTCIRETISQLP